MPVGFVFMFNTRVQSRNRIPDLRGALDGIGVFPIGIDFRHDHFKREAFLNAGQNTHREERSRLLQHRKEQEGHGGPHQFVAIQPVPVHAATCSRFSARLRLFRSPSRAYLHRLHSGWSPSQQDALLVN